MAETDGQHVLITGAAGMIGRKLVASLATRGTLRSRPITRLTLADIVAPAVPDAAAIDDIASEVVDLSAPDAARPLLEPRPDVIFHLAAIVSGEAETDMAKGYAVNLDGTLGLINAMMDLGAGDGWRPRVVFTSSIGVFGGPYPRQIPDDFHLTPHTSYGTQKAIGELLFNDYSRRGFVDAISLRLPTICVRPGAPNKAASGFFSSILREPLVGEAAVLPVDDTVGNWFASPRAAVGFLEHAATLDTNQLEGRTALTMPGISASVADEIDALRRAAGPEATELIAREPDPAIMAITSGWPHSFAADRALQLGFAADASMDAIVRTHIDEELGGTLKAWPDAPLARGEDR